MPLDLVSLNSPKGKNHKGSRLKLAQQSLTFDKVCARGRVHAAALCSFRRGRWASRDRTACRVHSVDSRLFVNTLPVWHLKLQGRDGVAGLNAGHTKNDHQLALSLLEIDYTAASTYNCFLESEFFFKCSYYHPAHCQQQLTGLHNVKILVKMGYVIPMSSLFSFLTPTMSME